MFSAAGTSAELYLPAWAPLRSRLPLVVALHYPESYRTRAQALADAHGCAIALAEDFNEGFLDGLCAAYPLDTERVSLTGWSAGGARAWGAAAMWPDLIASINPLFTGFSYRHHMAADGEVQVNWLVEFFPGLRGMPIRFTPEKDSGNDQVYFRSIARLFREWADRNPGTAVLPLIDQADAMRHSGEGMAADLDKAFPFMLAQRRRGLAREWWYDNLASRRSLYWLREMEFAGKGPYLRVYAKAEGMLVLDAENLKNARVSASDWADLGLDRGSAMLNGRLTDLSDAWDGVGVTLSLPDLDFSAAEDEPATLSGPLRGSYAFSNDCGFSARIALPLEASSIKGRKRLRIVLDGGQRIVSARLGGMAVKARALTELILPDTPWEIDLSEEGGERPVLELALSGMAPVDDAHRPLRLQLPGQAMMGMLPFRLSQLLPRGLGGMEEAELEFSVSNPDAASLYRQNRGCYLSSALFPRSVEEGQPLVWKGALSLDDRREILVLGTGRISLSARAGGRWIEIVSPRGERELREPLELLTAAVGPWLGEGMEDFLIIDGQNPAKVALDMLSMDEQAWLDFSRSWVPGKGANPLLEDALYPGWRGSLHFTNLETEDLKDWIPRISWKEWERPALVPAASALALLLAGACLGEVDPAALEPTQKLYAECLQRYIGLKLLEESGLAPAGAFASWMGELGKRAPEDPPEASAALQTPSLRSQGLGFIARLAEGLDGAAWWSLIHGRAAEGIGREAPFTWLAGEVALKLP